MDIPSTVLSGVAVFVVGQVVVKAFIEPSRDLARTRGEIAHALIFYANVYTRPGISELEKAVVARPPERETYITQETKQLDEVHLAFRKLASDLMARQQAIPLYTLWEKVRLVPKRSDILAASRNLHLISNNMFNSGQEIAEENKQARRDIERCLNLKLGFGT